MFWHVIKRAEEDDGTWKTKETLANKSRHVISFYLRVECTLVESSSFITSLCHIYNNDVLVFWLNTELCRKTMNCQIVIWISTRSLLSLTWNEYCLSKFFLIHENHSWFFCADNPVLGISFSTVTFIFSQNEGMNVLKWKYFPL